MTRFIARFYCRMLLVLMAFGALSNMAQAQDPGLPDSVILFCDSVIAYNPGNRSYVNVGLFCVTDDSILFTNMPFRWLGDIEEVYPIRVTWQNTFSRWWDTYYIPPDSGSNHFNILAFGIQSIPLFTGYNREREALIKFVIEPTALPQVIVIDTVTDALYGKIEFANIDVTFRPKFKGARFRYGIPGQGVGDANRLPEGIAIGDCYPNPFNGSTKIELELSETACCRVIIYDILGREIAYLVDGELQAGQYSVAWNGKDKSGGNCGSGVYFVKLAANNRVQTKRITLIR